MGSAFRVTLDFWEWATELGLDAVLTPKVLQAGNYSNKRISERIVWTYSRLLLSHEPFHGHTRIHEVKSNSHKEAFA